MMRCTYVGVPGRQPTAGQLYVRQRLTVCPTGVPKSEYCAMKEQVQTVHSSKSISRKGEINKYSTHFLWKAGFFLQTKIKINVYQSIQEDNIRYKKCLLLISAEKRFNKKDKVSIYLWTRNQVIFPVMTESWSGNFVIVKIKCRDGEHICLFS